MILFDEDTNFFELLSIPPDATPDEIELAYKRTLSLYEPENTASISLFSPEERRNLKIRIDEAYSTLTNQNFKHDYVEKIGIRITRPPLVAVPSALSEILPKIPAETNANKLKAFVAHQSVWDGFALSQAREISKTSIDDLCHLSKIPKKFILALEANQIDKLPARVYVRGFLLQIARILNLPREDVIRSYLEINNLK